MKAASEDNDRYESRSCAQAWEEGLAFTCLGVLGGQRRGRDGGYKRGSKKLYLGVKGGVQGTIIVVEEKKKVGARLVKKIERGRRGEWFLHKG